MEASRPRTPSRHRAPRHVRPPSRHISSICATIGAAALAVSAACNPLVPPPPYYGPPTPDGSTYQPPFDPGPLPVAVSTPIIVNGLPLGSTINITDAFLLDVTYGQSFSGGALGGLRQDSRAHLQITLDGTGSLATFHTVVVMPVTGAVDSASHPFGGLSQSFGTDMVGLHGQIAGDPDFDLLRVTGGTAFGMPSPGHTTLTRPSVGGNWQVDSFFDITYQIDFVGTPGGRLSGMAGSTTSTSHIQIGNPVPVIPPSLTLNPGIDLFTTPGNGSTYQDFTPINPIPANFFGPGSDPFTGRITFAGAPLNTNPPSSTLGPTDTIVRRNSPGSLPLVGGTATVPIEIVALSLVSVAPITVTYHGGQLPEPWNVSACLSSVQPQQQGGMTVKRDFANGGTFSSTLPVVAHLTFTRTSPPSTQIIDPAPMLQFSASGPWTSAPDPLLQLYTAPPGLQVDGRCNGTFLPLGPGTSNFTAGVLDLLAPCGSPVGGRSQVKRLTTEQALLAAHGVLPAQHLTLDTDGDGFPDDADNCPYVFNPTQADSDGDGWGDVCDNCPTDPNTCQTDENINGIGDACDPLLACILPGDVNGDSLVDGQDVLPFVQVLLTGSSVGNNAGCCELDGIPPVNVLDVQPFVVKLLSP